jgi:elongation factor P
MARQLIQIVEVCFMISAGEFRNGVTFDLDGQVFQIVEFQHVKPGKGAAFVRTKLKNVITGATVERTFNPTDKMQNAVIERKDMQYMYNDGELFFLMDTETFDQVPLSKETVGDTLKFVKEEIVVKVLSYKENVFGIEPPYFVELKITQTEPGFKGDTATGANKPATVETGATVKVPLFVNEGEVIRIDTRTGEYMERA